MEFAFGLHNPNSEFERDIFKCLLAIDDGWELEWANLSLLKNRLEHAQKIEVQPSKTYQTSVNVE